MDIAFFGDSLTFGAPGVSYFNLLEKTFPQHELLNFGQGGDTVVSLYRRIRELPAEKFDMAFLWVGVNDELVHASWTYPLLKKLHQNPPRNCRGLFPNQRLNHRSHRTPSVHST